MKSLLFAFVLAIGAPPPETPLLGFGSSVALDGERILVGRSGVAAGFPTPPNSPGSVHVFARQDGEWKEVSAFAGNDTRLLDGFGSVMAIDGEWLAVAAPEHGGGVVYVFQRRANNWTQVSRITASETVAGDRFGGGLAIRDGVLLIGAPGRDSSRGALYVSRRDSKGSWSAAVQVASGTDAGASLGSAIAFDGTRALVGAPGPMQFAQFGGGNVTRQKGVVVVYKASGVSFVVDNRLEASADSALGFGTSIYLGDNGAIVGAPFSRGGIGLVQQFQLDGAGRWSPGPVIAPPSEAKNQLFGMSVARTGTDLLVGSPGANNLKGAIQAYKLDAPTWTHSQELTEPVGGFGALLGMALAARGSLAAAGAPLNQFFEGEGYAYTRDASGTWRRMETLADAPARMTAITGNEVKCTGAKAGGFDCSRVDLEAFVPVADLGLKRGIMLNDIWGWTDKASRREFALVGKMDGTVFVEVTNPSNPVVLGTLPMHEGANPNLWRDIKVYKDHAFIVADGSGPHGMQVFDLRQLLDVKGAPVTFKETAHYDRIASAHNIAINEETGFAYTIGNSAGGETCGGALHMINIQDPVHPVFAGCFADPSTGNAKTGYTHDNQCVTYRGPDTRYAGREICFNSSETAVGIADVTDKQNPRPLAVASYPNTAYTHQGWLDETQSYFFVDDEGDEVGGLVPRTRTLVWDVKNLEEPVLVKEFLGTTAASDHNLYVRGKYMFQSNYVAGLRVVDISDPANPREVGYFDTVPAGDNIPGFAGSWSNYPYFPSGTIIVTSMREGLFVLKHRPEEATP